MLKAAVLIFFAMTYSAATLSANASDSVDKYINTLNSIDPNSTKNPERTKQLQKLITDFGKCLKKNKISDERAKLVMCGAALSSQLEKLNADVQNINQHSFSQLVKDQVLKNLSESYSYLAANLKDSGMNADLCTELDNATAQARGKAKACNETQSSASKSIFSHYKAEKKADPITMNNLKNELTYSVNGYKDAVLDITKCDVLEAKIAADPKNEKLQAQKKELQLISTQIKASEALHQVELQHEFLYTVLESNADLKRDLIQEIKEEKIEGKAKYFDPFDDENNLKQTLLVERNKIITQAGEIIGLGSAIKKSRFGSEQLDEPNGDVNVDSMEFLVSKYPTVVGKYLFEYPTMLKSVCDAFGKLNNEPSPTYTWGDKIRGHEVESPIGADSKVSLISGALEIQGKSGKDYSFPLSVAGKTCDAINSAYKEKKLTATKRDLNSKEKDLANALRLAQRKMPAVNIDLDFFKHGLGFQSTCQNENYYAFESDMMDHSIETLNSIASDPEKAKLFNKFTKDSYLNGDKFAGEKMLLFFAKLSTLPKNKIGDMPTQSDFLSQIVNDIKNGTNKFSKFLEYNKKFCCRSFEF